MTDLPVIARLAAAAATGCLATLALGPIFLRLCGSRCGERIKSASARLDALQASKARTPTMGGLVVIAAVLLAGSAWADATRPEVLALAATLVGFGTLGAADDLVKLKTARRGLSARAKFAAQLGLAAAVVAPFVGGDAEWWRVAMTSWAVFVVVGASNGVNLTDGMDGLAGGCGVTAATGLAFAAAAIGAGMLEAPPSVVPAAATEVAVVVASLAGALGGFLRFNRFPAKMFLGDTGALSVGAAIGVAAVLCRLEWVLAVCGGVFVAETLSVVAQVAGREVFGRKPLLCSPLHNHFLFAGASEPAVVARFWAVSAVLTMTALAAIRLV